MDEDDAVVARAAEARRRKHQINGLSIIRKRFDGQRAQLFLGTALQRCHGQPAAWMVVILELRSTNSNILLEARWLA